MKNKRALFLTGTLVTLALIVGGSQLWVFSQSRLGGFVEPLNVPELAESTLEGSVRTFDLTLQAGTTEFVSDVPIETWGINGDYLAPTLRVTDGEQIKINVANSLPEDTTLHWHGLHVPAEMDGGPHQPIEMNAMWSPHWTVSQAASTNWYHPHLHGRSEAHVKLGVVGMFIVDDAVESKLNLPRNYGIDDLPIIVHDSPTGLSSGNPLDFIGELFGSRQGDSLTLVNGQHEPYVEVSTSLLRLRLLNASIGDVFDFSFDDGRDFSIIASEGGLFDKPVVENSLLMSPGERYEIVVAFEPGETVRLNRSLLDDDNGAPADSESTLEFRAGSALQNLGALPDVMVTLPETSLDNVARTRTFDMSGVEINGLMMHMDRIDQVVHAGTQEIWSVRNLDSRELHNFHVHGVSFRVLSVDGAPPAVHQRWDKDTVLIPPETTVELLVKFPEVSSGGWPFMFHCHFLRHEGRGMMGQYLVVEPDESLDPSNHMISSMAHTH